jgi:hypothetical protein
MGLESKSYQQPELASLSKPQSNVALQQQLTLCLPEEFSKKLAHAMARLGRAGAQSDQALYIAEYKRLYMKNEPCNGVITSAFLKHIEDRHKQLLSNAGGGMVA